MQEIGRGYNALEIFSQYAVTSQWGSILRNKAAHEDVAEESIHNIKKEFNDRDKERIAEAIVSCDGTWQKRGHSWLNGNILLSSEVTMTNVYTTVFAVKNEDFVNNGRVKKSPLNTISSWLAIGKYDLLTIKVLQGLWRFQSIHHNWHKFMIN